MEEYRRESPFTRTVGFLSKLASIISAAGFHDNRELAKPQRSPQDLSRVSHRTKMTARVASTPESFTAPDSVHRRKSRKSISNWQNVSTWPKRVSPRWRPPASSTPRQSSRGSSESSSKGRWGIGSDGEDCDTSIGSAVAIRSLCFYPDKGNRSEQT